MNPLVIIHYHEISLKGRNRKFFEDTLRLNIARTLKGIVPTSSVKRGYGRMMVWLPRDTAHDSPMVAEVQRRLQKIFGIANSAVGSATQLSIEAICQTAEALLQGQTFETFAIDTKRADKSFPLTSPQVDQQVGAYIKEQFQKGVNLSDPDITVTVEIVSGEAYVHTGKIPGPGGLPVGVSGKVVSLLSAGFDSPVASYQVMKRGAEVIFIHFHSYPYVSQNSICQVRELVKVLTQYQFESILYLLPFAETQKVIVSNAPSPLRIILYRRMMLRVAEAIARKEKAEALVTGENLGQVASQTLRNINVINQVATLPILRPLIGEDKREIIEFARRIGTYDISSEPYDDCCSFLTTRNPETWAKPDEVISAEAKLDIRAMVESLLADAVQERIAAN